MKETERQNKKKGKPMEKALDLTNLSAYQTDPQGSYTGQPLNPWEMPVQDADDL